jgi:hypothetical protein
MGMQRIVPSLNITYTEEGYVTADIAEKEGLTQQKRRDEVPAAAACGNRSPVVAFKSVVRCCARRPPTELCLAALRQRQRRHQWFAFKSVVRCRGRKLRLSSC